MSGTSDDDTKPKSKAKQSEEDAAAAAPVQRSDPAPRVLTLAEREALRARLQKKFH